MAFCITRERDQNPPSEESFCGRRYKVPSLNIDYQSAPARPRHREILSGGDRIGNYDAITELAAEAVDIASAAR